MADKCEGPLFLEPVFTHNVWGGTRLRDQFHYPVEGDDIGECWGVAAHEHGDCKVKSGMYAGETLVGLWEKHREIFGNLPGDRFPLLVKIIDAKEDLSIQVHPDDAYAAEHEHGSLGKMECWYILDCPENARLVIGHNAKSRAELREMVEQKRWGELIREIPVKPGDFIQIDPGTVHAIKGGILLLETQQNSDVTYRLYDYDRLSNGKPRQLHIAQSLDVITAPAKPANIKSAAGQPVNELVRLISCPYYQVFLLKVDQRMRLAQSYPFLILSVTEGEGAIDGVPLQKGDHLIVPADYGSMELTGKMELIASTVAE